MANATKTLNIRVDAQLKESAEQVFSTLGLPMSTAINMFLKASVRLNGLPLDLNLNHTLPNMDTEMLHRIADNAAYLAKLDRSFREAQTGHLHPHELIEVE